MTVDVRLFWTGRYDNSGFKQMELELRNRGKRVDAIKCYSGFASRQNEPFVHPKNDWAGSGRVIHEGVFNIGQIYRGQFDAGIGQIWIPVEVQQQFKCNNRGAFGFHDDANRSSARGSAGCIVFYAKDDLEYVIKWLQAKAKPSHLVVDLGTGWLAEAGYKEPNDPDAGEDKGHPETCPTCEQKWPENKPTPPRNPEPAPSRISNDGLEIVRHFEGLHRLRSDGQVESYLDPVQVWTIGWGHTKTARPGLILSQQQCKELLAQDMGEFETAVRRAVKVPLKQCQFDALVCFAFNVGEGALSRSTLLAKLNAGDFAGAAAEFPRWDKGTVNGKLTSLPGLVRRRKSERHLFETGDVNFFS